MTVNIQPSKIEGIIQAPASKSSMQRACAAALLSVGTSRIINPGKSHDDLAALEVIQKLGARVTHDEDGSLVIESNGINPVDDQINCGESGLGIRMFTPIAALSNKKITITGKGSLLTRPMNFFDEIFPALGIKVQSNAGKLPIVINGPLQASDIEVDGSLSSQFLTGLLMAIGAANISQKITIKVINLKSKPYIDLTLQVMESFGRNVTHTDYEYFHLDPQTQNYYPQTYTVEGDWSGAAFLLVAGAVSGNVVVKGLDVYSKQADKAILQALMACGCMLSINPLQIDVGTLPLRAFHFDATDCPDLFPPLVALAAYCNGTTSITGVTRLQHKESDRALTLQQEFLKMGVAIKIQDDLMLIEGGSKIKAASVSSHNDHRIAMACAVAALCGTGEVQVSQAEAINKSYPNFYSHLQSLGASVTVH